MSGPTDAQRWHELAFLIGLVSMTGRIEPHRKPQSLLLTGEPGSGKTAAVERFKPDDGEFLNPHLTFVTNATTMGLQTILKEQVARGVTHMVVPEFQTLLLKRNGVWDTMLGTLLPAMEEGVGDTYVGPKKIAFNGARLGMIACMPTDAYFVHAAQLHATGLLSRMLHVRYERAPDQVHAARYRVNQGDRSELSKIDVQLPNAITVKVPRKIADLMTDYARSVDERNIHRETSRFLALAQAWAYLDGESEVSAAQVYKLASLEYFWRV